MIMDSMGGYNSVVGHLLQQTLRCLCTDSDWVYSVFWRILPRHYPPPKWDSDSHIFDRSKGNKRNWILVWEDGYCDFVECARSAISSSNEAVADAVTDNYCNGSSNFMQPELFFKMSHEVYNFGEGLIGKVAADSSHKWVYKDPADADRNYSSSWQGALDPHPRTWESQFRSGIETIAIVAVKEGLVQLGSLKKKVAEDLNFVLSLQRKFNYLQSIPGVYGGHGMNLWSQQQQQQQQMMMMMMSNHICPSNYNYKNSHLNISNYTSNTTSDILAHPFNPKHMHVFSPPPPPPSTAASTTPTTFADILSSPIPVLPRHLPPPPPSSSSSSSTTRLLLPRPDDEADIVDVENDEDDEEEEEEVLEEEHEMVHRYNNDSSASAFDCNSAALHALLSRLPSVGSANYCTTNYFSPSEGLDSSNSAITFDITNTTTTPAALPHRHGMHIHHMLAPPAPAYCAHLRTCQ